MSTRRLRPASVGRRLLRVPIVVFGVVTLLFVLLQLAPGDPARLLLAPGMSEEVVEQIRANYGLDAPVHVQYVRWIAAAATGDLGWSLSAGRPVTEVIATLLPSTLLLVGTSLVLAFLVGIGIGSVQALRAGRPLDHLLNAVTLFFHSMPSYWLGIMMVLVFSLGASQAGWGWALPASGVRSAFAESLGPADRLGDRIAHMILPVATLTLVMVGGISRQLRTSLLEVLASDHVRAARARGVPEARVFFGHVLRNALGPVVTLAGLYLPLAIGGAVFVETIFGWPGMGRAVVTATTARDQPLVLGITVVVTVFVVLGNLLADLLHARIDPRIREGAR